MVDLNRQYGQVQPPAQRIAAKQAAQKLFGSDELHEGELSTALHGPGEQSAASLFTGAPLCIDCGTGVVNPLRSQPRRCRPCGQAKRRQHNAAERERKDAVYQRALQAAPPAGESEEVEEEVKEAPMEPKQGKSIWDPS